MPVGDGCFIVGVGRDKGMERWKDGFCNGVIGEVCDVYGGGFCGWRGMRWFFDGESIIDNSENR